MAYLKQKTSNSFQIPYMEFIEMLIVYQATNEFSVSFHQENLYRSHFLIKFNQKYNLKMYEKLIKDKNKIYLEECMFHVIKMKRYLCLL